MQRRQGETRHTRSVRAVGHGLRGIGVDLGEGMELAIGLGDPAEQGIDDLARRKLLCGEAGREFGQGEGMKAHVGVPLICCPSAG